MSKFFKTTDTEVRVSESTILVVEIGPLSFEVDSRYPWVDVYYRDSDELKEHIEQIDEDDMPIFTSHEELKVFALNWYFNNVEIIQEIKDNGKASI